MTFSTGSHSARLSAVAPVLERSQLFVASSLLAAGGALLALVGLSWVFALALTLIIALAAPLLGGGRRGALLLTFAFSFAFVLAANRLAGLIASKDDLSRSRTDYVVFAGNVQSSKFKETEKGRSSTVEVACLRQLSPRPKPLSGRVLVHAGPYGPIDHGNASFEPPLWGRTYIFRGRLLRPRPKLFSFEFDEQRWLALKEIYCQISCEPASISPLNSAAIASAQSDPASTEAPLKSACTAGSSLFFAVVAELRDYIVRSHCLAIGDERGRVLASMVLGDRAVSLSDSLRAAFNRVGLSHLLAASGLNLTIIVGAALFIFAGFSKRKSGAGLWQTLGAFVCVLFFVSLAGVSPSVTRATIMCLLLLWSGLLFRRLATGAALAFALWLSILLDPLSILDVGLELSYGATFGIIYFVPIFNVAQPIFLKRRPWGWIYSLSAVVLAAQCAVLPVQIFYFQKLSSLVLPANIFAEPLVAPITVCGFISSLVYALVFYWRSCPISLLSMVAALSRQMADCIDRLCAFLIDALLALTNFLGSSPLAYIHLGRPAASDVVVYYLTLFVAFLLAARQPGRALLLLIGASTLFTLQTFLNSPFIEVLQTHGQLVIFSPWSGTNIYQTDSAAGSADRSNYQSRDVGLPLPAYRRNFTALYLRSLCARGFPSATGSQPVASGMTFMPLHFAATGKTISPLLLGADEALLSPWPAAACEHERVQDVRLIRLKFWGLLWLLAAGGENRLL
jgi:ComEC/Rec2-related protein